MIFPECPIFLGKNEIKIKINLYNFPSQLNFPKLPKLFQAYSEKILVNLYEHKICQVPKILNRN